MHGNLWLLGGALHVARLPYTVERRAAGQVAVARDQGQVQAQRCGTDDAIWHVRYLVPGNAAQCPDDWFVEGSQPVTTTGSSGDRQMEGEG